ncbi:hypothetical protein IWQ60_007370, partial [Tieghemiomyces parasiticus]
PRWSTPPTPSSSATVTACTSVSSTPTPPSPMVRSLACGQPTLRPGPLATPGSWSGFSSAAAAGQSSLPYATCPSSPWTRCMTWSSASTPVRKARPSTTLTAASGTRPSTGRWLSSPTRSGCWRGISWP